MANEPLRSPYAGSPRPSGAAIATIVGAAFALVASTIMGLAGTQLEGPTSSLAVAGWIGFVLVALIAPPAVVLVARIGGRAPADGADRALVRLAETAALSDEARRIVNRHHERQLLRDAIAEEITAEDWDAAMVLVKDLAERYGYRAEAEEFRQRIEHARFETVQRKVNEAIARLDNLIIQRRWDQALVEAARIGRLYPDTPRAEGLRHRVEQARQSYKADLERRFLHAAQEERIDEAMELLKELDAYLTEAESAPFREVARGVIGKARENLGVQFKLAVQDRRWRDAAAVGERIVAEFPNTRMAQEVRGMLDSIRARAADAPAPV